MVINNQRFSVAIDIDGEPAGVGERAADQLQVAGVGLRLSYPAAARASG